MPVQDVIGIVKIKGIRQTYCVSRSPFPVQTFRFPAPTATVFVRHLLRPHYIYGHSKMNVIAHQIPTDSCPMLHDPSKKPAHCSRRLRAQSSSVISARPWNPRPPIEHIHAVRSFPSSFVQSAPHPSSSSPPPLSTNPLPP